MIIVILAGLFAAGIGTGYAVRSLVQWHRDEREAAEQDRIDAAVAEAIRENTPQPVPSGPPSPDIDAADPFADPDDFEALGPSEAELAWAGQHLVRDSSDPRFWMPENRRAMRILGMIGLGAEIDPEQAGAADWDQLVAELPTRAEIDAMLAAR